MHNLSPFNPKPASDASESGSGLVELATDAETISGTAVNLATTPANVEAKVGGAAVDATLSGTPKIFRIKDSSGASYYFKAYPTKT